MKRRRITFVIAVALLALGLFCLLRVPSQKSNGDSAPVPVTTPASAQPQSSPIAEAKRFKEASALVERIFSAPIEFYGRVIDQNGDPVPYANVGYTAADKFNASGSNYTGQSDEKGNFNIKGIKGAGLAVTVRKEGYYLIHNPGDRSLPTSTATFAFGMGPDSYRRPAPSKDKPAVFVLHKMGKPEALIFLSSRQFDVPKTGASLSIDLATGRSGGKDLTLESWTGSKTLNHFDWSYRLSVSDGGLLERKGEFDFEAPADGYHPQIEVKMPATAQQWSSRLSKQFFAKLPGNRYARFTIRFYPGVKDDDADRNFVVLESYINPTPGDRNLEFDPEKAIKP